MFEKVREIIADKLSISEDEITMDSSFLEDLNADSSCREYFHYDQPALQGTGTELASRFQRI